MKNKNENIEKGQLNDCYVSSGNSCHCMRRPFTTFVCGGRLNLFFVDFGQHGIGHDGLHIDSLKTEPQLDHDASYSAALAAK